MDRMKGLILVFLVVRFCGGGFENLGESNRFHNHFSVSINDGCHLIF